MNLQRYKGGAGERVQWLRLLAALTEDPAPFPALTLGALQLPGSLPACSGLCTHKHKPTYSLTSAYDQEKINIV